MEMSLFTKCPTRLAALTVMAIATLLTLTLSPAMAANNAACGDLPDYDALKDALSAVVAAGGNAGLGNNMWGTIVNRDGIVCAVAFTGLDRGDEWPGSRVISSQKANTANAFSLNGLFPELTNVGRALSTANLYEAVQPGGSLFGLQFSNPVDTSVAYGGQASQYGQHNDPMVGKKIGGVNVFGGGLALYDADGNIVGALGVSGDTSCTDHIIAWKVRDALNFDNIPGGVAPGGPNGTDNIIFPVGGGFGHPICLDNGEVAIAGNLPNDYPIGPNP